MVRLPLSLLLAAVCVSFVAGKCDQEIIDSIKQLRNGIDDSGLLDVVGDYDFVYASGRSSVPGGFSNSTCQVSTFYKDKDGKHRVGHNGVLAGDYVLEFKDGKELVIDPSTGAVLRNTYVVYASPNFGVTAFYSCSVSGTDISAGTVAVAKADIKAPSTAELVKKAENALTKVGLTVGTAITACY